MSAKKSHSVRQTQVKSNQGIGRQLEHTEIIDDNLLPDAVEIERLAAIDPDIINWLKKTAEKEQEFRHKLYERRDNIVKIGLKGEIRLNFFGLASALIIMAVALYLSYLLIMKDKIITGSIFGGTALVIAIGIFITRKRGNSNNQPL